MLEFGNKVAVKICGITSIADALTCAAGGADMLGLNFSPRSLRWITPATGAQIASAVRAQFPRIKLVGVFLDQESVFVKRVAANLTLDAVQLHGNETPRYVGELDLPCVIKAVRVNAATSVPDVSAYQCHAILLDSWSAEAPGGTGRTFPWSLAAELRPQVGRLILAGGLTRENVDEAIRAVRPFAVDVCSGVESTPGQKDEAKVRAFVESVKRSNHEKAAIRA